MTTFLPPGIGQSLVKIGQISAGNPITGIDSCCARAASGHAAVAPPSSVMKSRRLKPGVRPPPNGTLSLQ